MEIMTMEDMVINSRIEINLPVRDYKYIFGGDFVLGEKLLVEKSLSCSASARNA